MANGVDYAWGRPGGAVLAAAGKTFACRYASLDSSKNLTRAEADDLAAHGVSCVLVWETTANRALAGQDAGAADARAALQQAAACGMPDDRPVYFAVDFDATLGQQATIDAYLQGAASVLGARRVGVYGGYWVVSRAMQVKAAAWGWQTVAWSGGQWYDGAHIRQDGNEVIAGVDCDKNTASAADFGQWTPGHDPVPPAPPVPVVNLAHVVYSALHDPQGAQGVQSYPGDVRIVEAALVGEQLLADDRHAHDGSFGSLTVAAYRKWQERLGYTGADADGIPGQTSLAKLGDKHGFKVVPS
jgi:hypothetical protein